MALFGVPFIAIGVFLMVLALWRKITGVKIAPPVVLVSNPAPALGEKIRVEWELRFSTKTILQEARIELLFRESASYTQGTDSRTDRHEVVNEFSEIPIGEMTARESVHGQADFIIPEDGMHSFQGQNNQLEWLLRVRLNALEWPDLEEEYLLDVKAQKAWGL